MGESSKWVRNPQETVIKKFPNNGYYQGKGHAVPPALRSVAESAPVAPATLPQNQPWAMNPPRINDVKILKKVASWLCAHLLLLNCYNSVVVHFCTYGLSWVRCPRMYWHSTAIVVFRLADMPCNFIEFMQWFSRRLLFRCPAANATREMSGMPREQSYWKKRCVPAGAVQVVQRNYCQGRFARLISSYFNIACVYIYRERESYTLYIYIHYIHMYLQIVCQNLLAHSLWIWSACVSVLHPLVTYVGADWISHSHPSVLHGGNVQTASLGECLGLFVCGGRKQFLKHTVIYRNYSVNKSKFDMFFNNIQKNILY